MYSRKIALSLAKRYRRCPPPQILTDPSHEAACKKHRAICPYCSSGNRESLTVWNYLAREMKRVYPSIEKPGPVWENSVRPGQFRLIKPRAGVWRDNYFYTPPMVFIIRNATSIPGAVWAAQTYYDIQMAGPGDLILTVEETQLAPLFVECWNTYTLKETLLGPPLDTVSAPVLDGAVKCEQQTQFCPEWAVLSRPLVENDPRIFFRELELEVAYTFASQSVSQIMTDLEAPPLKQHYGSPVQIQEMIRKTIPGTHWKRSPQSPEEAFAMAELPLERIPLAAADKTSREITANLVRMEEGKVQSINPLVMKLHGRSGELILSGRIQDLPKDVHGSRLICFLEPEGGPPVSPVRCEWKAETGDFMLAFSCAEDTVWRLKAAVVFETARK